MFGDEGVLDKTTKGAGYIHCLMLESMNPEIILQIVIRYLTLNLM